jgi:hypothetical protein
VSDPASPAMDASSTNAVSTCMLKQAETQPGGPVGSPPACVVELYLDSAFSNNTDIFFQDNGALQKIFTTKDPSSSVFRSGKMNTSSFLDILSTMRSMGWAMAGSNAYTGKAESVVKCFYYEKSTSFVLPPTSPSRVPPVPGRRNSRTPTKTSPGGDSSALHLSAAAKHMLQGQGQGQGHSGGGVSAPPVEFEDSEHSMTDEKPPVKPSGGRSRECSLGEGEAAAAGMVGGAQSAFAQTLGPPPAAPKRKGSFRMNAPVSILQTELSAADMQETPYTAPPATAPAAPSSSSSIFSVSPRHLRAPPPVPGTPDATKPPSRFTFEETNMPSPDTGEVAQSASTGEKPHRRSSSNSPLAAANKQTAAGTSDSKAVNTSLPDEKNILAYEKNLQFFKKLKEV